MARISNKEMHSAFAALVHAYGHAGITEEINYTDDEHNFQTYTSTSADLILSEGSETYGNSWGVWISPWRSTANPQRWNGASAHYTPRGLGALSTNRREALAQIRAFTAGIYAAINA